ncbi:PIN domain-containing protein [Methylobacterium terricola]|uniref:PIN domain-containing protein n=1 Tax=Methylobacterium terricola TaxID=2583531 RepID=UPI003CCC8167
MIARGSKPVVRLVPIARRPFRIGLLEGRVGSGPDFFEPLPDDELDLWEDASEAGSAGHACLGLEPDQSRALVRQGCRRDRVGGSILVSPVGFFEIAQTVRIGTWPEMDPYVLRRPVLLDEQGGVIARLDPEICITAGTMAWADRDPFDRLLAATAQHRRVPLVSADAVFDGHIEPMS